MKEEIVSWRKKMGLDYIVRPDANKLEEAVQLSISQLDNMQLSDLDELLLVLSNYYVFLGSELGRVIARSNFLSDELRDEISKRGAKMEGGTAMERRALIISTHKDLSEMNKRHVVEKSKQAMLQPIYDSIKVKIDSVKRIYFRRTAEKRD